MIHLPFPVQFIEYVREIGTRTPHCAILAKEFPRTTKLAVIFPAGYAISQSTVSSKMNCIKTYRAHIMLLYSSHLMAYIFTWSNYTLLRRSPCSPGSLVAPGPAGPPGPVAARFPGAAGVS